MSDWYYFAGDRVVGPVPAAVLKDKATAGEVLPTTPVRLGTSPEWATASQVRGLFEPDPIQPPPDGTGSMRPPPAPDPARVTAIVDSVKKEVRDDARRKAVQENARGILIVATVAFLGSILYSPYRLRYVTEQADHFPLFPREGGTSSVVVRTEYDRVEYAFFFDAPAQHSSLEFGRLGVTWAAIAAITALALYLNWSGWFWFHPTPEHGGRARRL